MHQLPTDVDDEGSRSGNDPGGGGSPSTPSRPITITTPRSLRERVSFFEQVWSGQEKTSHASQESLVDVADIESRLLERRRLRDPSSPSNVARDAHRRPLPTEQRSFSSCSNNSESLEEIVERTEEEEGLLPVGARLVTFERITVHRSEKQVSSPVSRYSVSRSPSAEPVTQDDSAYHTASHRTNGASKSTSVASLAERFPSDESLSLRRTPSREAISGDAEGGSRANSPWYTEYKAQTFQHIASRLEHVRSRTEYDSHIAEIKGK